MGATTWAQRITHGAVAGLAGGAVSALMLWVAVQPSIQQAIDLEDAAGDGHSHGSAGAVGHDGGELVSRTTQMIGGTITVIVVGILFGIAFAIAYGRLKKRLPGETHLGRSMSLAVLAFAVLSLLPALKTPANPPGVGDPSTVTERTLIYLLTVLLGVLLVVACFAATRATRRWTEQAALTWTTGVATATIGGAAILVLVPGVAVEIPATIPASLVWEFRIGSLGQLAALWLGIGLVHGVLAHRQSRAGQPSASPTTMGWAG